MKPAAAWLLPVDKEALCVSQLSGLPSSHLVGVLMFVCQLRPQFSSVCERVGVGKCVQAGICVHISMFVFRRWVKGLLCERPVSEHPSY